MIIKHRAGPPEWEGVTLPDDPAPLVAALPGVKDRDYGVTSHLCIMGVREEQNRVVSEAKRRCEKDATDEEKVAAVHKALSNYTVGCTYKPKPSPLKAALESLDKAGVSKGDILMALTAGMTDDQKAAVKASILK